MKIDGFGSGGSLTGVTKTNKRRSEKAEKKASGVASAEVSGRLEGDTVELNHHRDTLNLIRDLVRASPDMREDEIDRVVRKIKESNGYQVNLDQVAEGFIREAILNELSFRRRG
ncbi:MAG: flagellar biosynthesis anti-sigma factor FlgM [Bradymonadales bacterium]|nr:MAG: flagellar biosynthesis anti-sigma factor FlgM [Bradymonadales bacterium]